MLPLLHYWPVWSVAETPAFLNEVRVVVWLSCICCLHVSAVSRCPYRNACVTAIRIVYQPHKLYWFCYMVKVLPKTSKINFCSALQHVFLIHYLKSGCDNTLYTVTNAMVVQCFNPSACCFLFLGLFSPSVSLSVFLKRAASCFQVDSKTVGLSEDRTVIMALVVLISSASAGFRGCQKWNKCKGCSNLLEVQVLSFQKNFSFGVRWSTEYECYVCANCIFWERTVSARQVSWLYCGWSGELYLSTISQNCFSRLSLPWACLALWLFMACHQRCAACLVPVFLTLWFRAHSDTLGDTSTVTCTLTPSDTLRHSCVCDCECDWVCVWVCRVRVSVSGQAVEKRGLMVAVNGQR